MIITLYHGSKKIVDKPTFGFGKAYNDYGCAFYCTQSLELAKEWGSSKDVDGFANAYEFDLSGLNLVDLNKPPYTILSWLALLLANRTFDLQNPIAAQGRSYLISTFLPDVSKADVIKGYRADDSYFSYAQDFLNNTISYRQLTFAMRLGTLGEQYAIKSKLAFSHLHYLGYHKAEFNVWFAKRNERDLAARNAYSLLRDEPLRKDDIFIRDILVERMTPDDPRLC
mgnify:CR=1 FL=1|jgi:hypothetical protein